MRKGKYSIVAAFSAGLRNINKKYKYMIVGLLILVIGVFAARFAGSGALYGTELCDKVYDESKNPIEIIVKYENTTILQTDLSFAWSSVPASYQDACEKENGVCLKSSSSLSMADTTTMKNGTDSYDYIQSELSITLPQEYVNQQYYVKAVNCNSYSFDDAFDSMTYEAKKGRFHLIGSGISGNLSIAVCQAGLRTYGKRYAKSESITIILEKMSLSGNHQAGSEGEHAYTSEVVKQASLDANGKILYRCTKCGDEYTETIPRIHSIVLKQDEVCLEDDGAENEFVVVDAEGSVIDPDYYIASYKDDDKIGLAEATITFKDLYTGTKSFNYHVILRKDKTIKILMVGQSMTYSSAHKEFMTHLKGILENAGYGNVKATVCAGGSTRVGPRGLIDMTNMKKKYYKELYSLITSESFDYIIFQDLQYNQYQPMTSSCRYYKGVAKLVSWVRTDKKSRNKNAKLIIRATWGNEPQLQSKQITDRMLSNALYLNTALELDGVSKDGLAFYYAYNEAAEKVTDLWREDGHHCSDTGGFLAAMTTYTTLTGSNPANTEYTGGLSTTVADNLKKIAWKVQNAE